MAKNNNQSNDVDSGELGKLGLIALIAVVVGSMIGGGVYSLPQNMAAHSAVGPVLIAWVITGIGVYFIANTFRILADVRPDLEAGVYMYAREGYGPYIGFTIAWGYWLMTTFGNVAFAIMLMDSLDYFFPGVFTGGNNLNSIICGSILIWGYNYLVNSGIKLVGFVNTVGTIAKLVPLVVFIILVGVAIKDVQFDIDFWGQSAAATSHDLGSISAQIMTPMLVTLWVFVGIEGAVVLSGRARNHKDVGKATLIGFFIALVVYALLSVLPFGVISQATLSTVQTPSTAGVLELVVGRWGAWLMSIGVIISVLSGWLAWTMLCAEIPFIASQDGTFPKIFAKQNKKGSATVSLFVSSSVMQVAIILVYFSNDAWNTMLSITSVMVLPAYLASTLFLYKISRGKEHNELFAQGKRIAMYSGVLGFVFCLFMLYAGGMQYVVMIPLLLTLGIPVFIWSRKEHNSQEPVFAKKEIPYVVVLVLLDALALGLFFTDTIKL